MLYKKTELMNGLFFKIKTVADYNTFEDMPQDLQNIWDKKYSYKYINQYSDFTEKGKLVNSYNQHALYVPEFSSIVEVSIGMIEELSKGKYDITVIPFTGLNEKKLLTEVADTMNKFPGYILGGYNVAGYQIPFLIKRMLINKVPLPTCLLLKGKKPWEINVIDIMKDYQGSMFGDVDLLIVANQFKIKVDLAKENYTAAEELNITLQLALAMSI